MAATKGPPVYSVRERLATYSRGISAKELEEITGIDVQVINKYAREGVLPSFSLGTVRRFDPRAICEWYDSQQT